MTLTLKIRNMDRLDNGMPAEFVLNRRGAMIGRAATCDWSLPDPRNFISSRHLEVSYRDGAYSAADISTNGTFLNGATERMAAPRRIEPGDVFQVGMYEISTELTGEAAVAIERREEQAAAEAEKQAGWSWDAHGGGGAPAASPAPDRGGWDAAPPGSGASQDDGWGTPATGGDGAGWGAPTGGRGDDAGWGTPAAGASEWATPAAPAEPVQPGAGWGAPTSGSDQASASWATAPDNAAGSGSWGPSGAGSAPSSTGAGWGAPQPEGPRLGRAAPYAQQPGASLDGTRGASDPLGGANNWSPAAPPPPAPSPSVWDSAKAPVQQASAWSSAISDRPRQAKPDDIWGSMESSNVVDWARADFGQRQATNDDPLGLKPKPATDALPREAPIVPSVAPSAPETDAGWGTPEPAAGPAAASTPPTLAPAQSEWGSPASPSPSAAVASDAGWGAPPPSPPAPPTPAAVTPPPAQAPTGTTAPADLGQVIAMLATAAGLKPEQVKEHGPATIERAGIALRRLVSGLVVMVEARARAKSQMGAEQTGLEFDGNNPIKFARSPDQALAQMLNPTERGFMPTERAIEDAYFDLQSHQMATLKAMQGALRATLDRFSPNAIKKRAESGGFMARLLPGGREATLWATYEKEFSGVAQGSDEAFMDVFSKEFRKAYDEQSRNRKRG